MSDEKGSNHSVYHSENKGQPGEANVIYNALSRDVEMKLPVVPNPVDNASSSSLIMTKFYQYLIKNAMRKKSLVRRTLIQILVLTWHPPQALAVKNF